MEALIASVVVLAMVGVGLLGFANQQYEQVQRWVLHGLADNEWHSVADLVKSGDPLPCSFHNLLLHLRYMEREGLVERNGERTAWPKQEEIRGTFYLITQKGGVHRQFLLEQEHHKFEDPS